QQGYNILDIHAHRSEASGSVDPRIVERLHEFGNLAQILGIEVNPPKDVLERISNLMGRFRQNFTAITTVATKDSTESTGRWMVGKLSFKGGEPIEIPFNEEPVPIYNDQGEMVGEVYAVPQKDKIMIPVLAAKGQKIYVQGDPISDSWI